MSKKITYLTPAQLTKLSKMQDQLNQLTCLANFGHKDWRSMHFNWDLAIVDEVMEIHGHLGWKWWKGSDKYKIGLTEENKKQVQLEVIDILHFALSKSMQFDQDFSSDNSSVNDWTLEDCLEEFIFSTMHARFHWSHFNDICALTDLTATKIMEIYTGKYALNIFRQDHGYGEGTYMKEWLIPEVSIKYQEDNWYLELIIGEIKREGDAVSVERITFKLEQYYKLATGGGK